MTTFDAADHYGPAEALIGRYFAQHPEQRSSAQVRLADCSGSGTHPFCTHPLHASTAPQVFSKYCVFSARDMVTLNKAAVAAAVDVSRKRVGGQVDLMQLYWGDYSYDK